MFLTDVKLTDVLRHRFFYANFQVVPTFKKKLLIIFKKCCIILQNECGVCYLAQKKKTANKFGITPSMIFLNLTIILLICIVIFFTYNVIKGDTEEGSSVPPFTAVTSAPETQATTETTAPDTTISAPSSTVENSSSVTSDISDSSENPESSQSSESDIISVDFDKEYFSTSLFIGDSITTGLSLYGFLDADNVFATQGLAPSTVLTAEIDGMTFESKIASFKPKRIFIMLGTNSVGYGEAEDLVASLRTLVDDISGLCNSEIYVLSIPPVTQAADLSNENYLTIDAITEYNNLLKEEIGKTDAKFIDFYSVLVDSDGYFNEDYAEMDGIHFMGKTYQVMLSFLEKQTS